jgi:hypothetical protein
MKRNESLVFLCFAITSFLDLLKLYIFLFNLFEYDFCIFFNIVSYGGSTRDLPAL